jgi:predicted nuclease of predicted toxin-antitoxin system
MPPRLLANENFPRPALLRLRAAGVLVDSVAERMPRAADTVVLAHAAAAGAWLVTFDRDDGELVFARRAPPPPAILYLRQGVYLPEWPAEAVLSALAQEAFVSGHLVVITGRSMRRRLLPGAVARDGD